MEGRVEERGLQEPLDRTHGSNQEVGWRSGRETVSAGVGWRDGEKGHTSLIE